MIRAICFDFDGTLAHFAGDFFVLIAESAKDLGVPKQLPTSFAKMVGDYTRFLATSLEITRQTLSDLGLASPENLELLCAARRLDDRPLPHRAPRFSAAALEHPALLRPRSRSRR